MPFKDLRAYIAKLENEGEVKKIEDEVDCHLEMGAIVRRANEAGLPSPFFQKIKDYPDGYRVVGGILAKLRRIAIAMDLDPNTSVKTLIDEYLDRKGRPIRPVLVKDGPCKENIHLGDAVDLQQFPVPLVHEGDGGPYIGTWHLTISRNTHSDWVNWGMYRHMLHNRNTIGLQAGPPTHIMRMCRQYNEPMEVAIVIGTEPITTFCAASPIPYEVSEVDIVGGIRGDPVELIKCETVNLAVPATAEIVIEGEIRPNELMDEGPFGEYTGYRGGHKEPRPVIHVKAVTHRNNPVFAMSCMGVPIDDSHAVHCVTRSAGFLEALKEQGIPVSGVYVPPEAVTYLVVVAVKGSSVRADQIAHTIWASRAGGYTPYIIVVEDDVDPFNIAEVLHAVVTKCHPRRGIVALGGSIASALVPWANRHEQKHLLGAKVYFDCTWPPDWEPVDIPKKMSFDEAYPSEIQQKARTLWKKYGY